MWPIFLREHSVYWFTGFHHLFPYLGFLMRLKQARQQYLRHWFLCCVSRHYLSYWWDRRRHLPTKRQLSTSSLHYHTDITNTPHNSIVYKLYHQALFMKCISYLLSTMFTKILWSFWNFLYGIILTRFSLFMHWTGNNCLRLPRYGIA